MTKQEAIKKLKSFVKRGGRLYGVLRHRTPIRRYVDVYAVKGGILHRVTGYIVKAVAPSYSDKHEAIVTGDPDLIAYHLGQDLYGDGHSITLEVL